MRYLIIILFTLGSNFSIQNGECQNFLENEGSFINNKIDFSVVMMSCDTCAPIKNIGNRVVLDLQESELNTINKISKDCWLRLLQNENTDWAANLILYNIFGRDAFLLSEYELDDWKKYLKQEDIEYWSEHIQ